MSNIWGSMTTVAMSQSQLLRKHPSAASDSKSSVLFKKDDSGYEGDDLSLIDDLDSLDDALAAHSHSNIKMVQMEHSTQSSNR